MYKNKTDPIMPPGFLEDPDQILPPRSLQNNYQTIMECMDKEDCPGDTHNT
jgi:hypothetical protein